MTASFLVLAHAGDVGARGLVAALTVRFGKGQVMWLQPETLNRCGWTHRVAPDGVTSTTLRLPSGALLDGAAIQCVLNRMTTVPLPPRFVRASPKDCDYVLAEQHALLTSWLAGFDGRIVPTGGASASAACVRPFRAWMLDAVLCGLPIGRDIRANTGRLLPANAPPDPVGTARHGLAQALPSHRADVLPDSLPVGHVLVAGDRTCGPLARSFGTKCLRLARRAGCPLVAFYFARSNGDLLLCGVDTLPTLAADEEIEAVVHLLVDAALRHGGGS